MVTSFSCSQAVVQKILSRNYENISIILKIVKVFRKWEEKSCKMYTCISLNEKIEIINILSVRILFFFCSFLFYLGNQKWNWNDRQWGVGNFSDHKTTEVN